MNKYWRIFFFITLLFLPFYGYPQTNSTALTVNLYPAEIRDLGGGWQISGVSDDWYSSGKTVFLDEGTYTITFKTGIRGWAPPEDKEVRIEKGEAIIENGIYERLTGSLKVTLLPTKAVDEGAKWRRVGQEIWQDSGAIEDSVPTDIYTIEFKKIPGWKVPDDIVIDLKAGIINGAAGVYEERGSLIVNITPAEAVKAGAMWKLTKDNIYRKSGEKIENLNLGEEYTIDFKSIDKWTKPASIKVILTDNVTVTKNGEYTLISTSEGASEGTTEGEGSGNEEKSSCGCEKSMGINSLKKIINDFLIVGICISVLGLWMGIAKREDKN